MLSRINRIFISPKNDGKRGQQIRAEGDPSQVVGPLEGQRFFGGAPVNISGRPEVCHFLEGREVERFIRRVGRPRQDWTTQLLQEDVERFRHQHFQTLLSDRTAGGENLWRCCLAK